MFNLGSSFFTSLRKGDTHLQHNSFDLLSLGLPWQEPYLFHIPAHDLHVGRYPFTTCFVNGPPPPPPPPARHSPSSWLRLFLSQTLSHMDTPTILKFSHYLPTCLWRWNRQSVPKRRHIKFRRRGITQKKTYNKHVQIKFCFLTHWKTAEFSQN